jgi:hypothetical protein
MCFVFMVSNEEIDEILANELALHKFVDSLPAIQEKSKVLLDLMNNCETLASN